MVLKALIKIKIFSFTTILLLAVKSKNVLKVKATRITDIALLERLCVNFSIQRHNGDRIDPF